MIRLPFVLKNDKMLFTVLLAALIGCLDQPDSYDCVTDDDLIERWLELSSVSSIDNCYLLSSDGLLIEKNQDGVWGIGFWETVSRDENCIYEADLDGEYVEIIGKEGSCLVVDYQSQEVILCDCQY